MKKSKLPITEELDFHYLLQLLPALQNEPEFAWLPELFSIVGYESLINLCKYAGGETIKIPTLKQLSNSIDALQWFYDLHITKTKSRKDVPPEISELVNKIFNSYAENN